MTDDTPNIAKERSDLYDASEYLQANAHRYEVGTVDMLAKRLRRWADALAPSAQQPAPQAAPQPSTSRESYEAAAELALQTFRHHGRHPWLQAGDEPNRRWMLVFSDPDQRTMFWDWPDAEHHARAAYALYCSHWSCDLYATVEAQPAPQAKQPCGECHLQPGERCDVCGAGESWMERARRLMEAKDYTSVLAMLRAPHARDEGGAVEEWVLVPREPDINMIAAWWRQKNNGTQEPGRKDATKTSDYDAYRALIAAAPSPPTAPLTREGEEPTGRLEQPNADPEFQQTDRGMHASRAGQTGVAPSDDAREEDIPSSTTEVASPPKAPQGVAPSKKGKLRLELELDLRRMTRAEAGDGEPVPMLHEYAPHEIAETVAYALDGEDAQAEMFAGSMMFVKITKVSVKAASWDGAPTGAALPPRELTAGVQKMQTPALRELTDAEAERGARARQDFCFRLPNAITPHWNNMDEEAKAIHVAALRAAFRAIAAGDGE